jgi:hypothetical protein
MIMKGENQTTPIKTCTNATLSTINCPWSSMVWPHYCNYSPGYSPCTDICALHTFTRLMLVIIRESSILSDELGKSLCHTEANAELCSRHYLYEFVTLPQSCSSIQGRHCHCTFFYFLQQRQTTGYQSVRTVTHTHHSHSCPLIAIFG